MNGSQETTKAYEEIGREYAEILFPYIIATAEKGYSLHETLDKSKDLFEDLDEHLDLYNLSEDERKEKVEKSIEILSSEGYILLDDDSKEKPSLTLKPKGWDLTSKWREGDSEESENYGTLVSWLIENK